MSTGYTPSVPSSSVEFPKGQCLDLSSSSFILPTLGQGAVLIWEPCKCRDTCTMLTFNTLQKPGSQHPPILLPYLAPNVNRSNTRRRSSPKNLYEADSARLSGYELLGETYSPQAYVTATPTRALHHHDYVEDS